MLKVNTNKTSVEAFVAKYKMKRRGSGYFRSTSTTSFQGIGIMPFGRWKHKMIVFVYSLGRYGNESSHDKTIEILFEMINNGDVIKGEK